MSIDISRNRRRVEPAQETLAEQMLSGVVLHVPDAAIRIYSRSYPADRKLTVENVNDPGIILRFINLQNHSRLNLTSVMFLASPGGIKIGVVQDHLLSPAWKGNFVDDTGFEFKYEWILEIKQLRRDIHVVQ